MREKQPLPKEERMNTNMEVPLINRGCGPTVCSPMNIPLEGLTGLLNPLQSLPVKT